MTLSPPQQVLSAANGNSPERMQKTPEEGDAPAGKGNLGEGHQKKPLFMVILEKTRRKWGQVGRAGQEVEFQMYQGRSKGHTFKVMLPSQLGRTQRQGII